jgi:hypothetical protein
MRVSPLSFANEPQQLRNFKKKIRKKNLGHEDISHNLELTRKKITAIS